MLGHPAVTTAENPLDDLAAGIVEAARDAGAEGDTAAATAIVQMTAVFAELERRLIGERTRAALAGRRRRASGLVDPPVLADRMRQRVRRERADGRSYRVIAERLNAKACPSSWGCRQSWHASTVRAVLMGPAFPQSRS